MWHYLYNLFFLPIEYVLDLIFTIMAQLMDSYGLAIIFVSLFVQIMTTPLYNKGEQIQAEERQKQKSMEKWINHIKATFKGKERFMMLSTYYREEGYKPIYALRGSVSLLLQVPFFIAAYHFLSNLGVLEGKPLLFLSNLGKPDSTFTVGNFSINVMPVLMTVINICSSYIYAKNFTKKEKIQLYAMALLFLVILYNSPSGLVLYWTMNNVFSLFKNVANYLIKNKRRFINISCALFGIAFFIKIFFLTGNVFLKKKLLGIGITFICFLPLLLTAAGKIFKKTFNKEKTIKENEKIQFRSFLLPAVFISLLIGCIIPMSVISSSPLEFVYDTYGPLSIIANTATIAFGFFVVWFGVFFLFSSDSLRKKFVYGFWFLAVIFSVNFFFFGKNLGVLTESFEFGIALEYTSKEKLLNTAIIFVSAVLFLVFLRKFKDKLNKGKLSKAINYLFIIMILSSITFCVIKAINTKQTENEYRNRESTDPYVHKNSELFTLSKNAPNVILIMLDRVVSAYFPYMTEERQDIAQAFKDFTYYPNTLSFGCKTNLAAAPIFGGYEYTPDEMNKRDKEKLEKKHNEALKVLPVLFLENGFDVTACDPPYAGYSWISDMSIYNPYPQIKGYNLIGKFKNSIQLKTFNEETSRKNQIQSAFFYSLMRCIPVPVQSLLYYEGTYWSSTLLFSYDYGFINSATGLICLPDITGITEEEKGSFFMMQNDTPHQPTTRLNYPDYSILVPGEELNSGPSSRVLSDGSVLEFRKEKGQYYATIFSFIQLAKWIEFLKENNVYDNTRIIITSDHGHYVEQFDYMFLDNGVDVERFNPILLVKDFNARNESSYITDNSFMTNADAAVLSVQDVIADPVNPFTGKILDDSEKSAHPQLMTTSQIFEIDKFINTFDTSDGHWYEVKDNIFDVSNWTFVK